MSMTKEQFKALRTHLKLTQKQWGELLGYGAPAIRVNEVEAGRIAISRPIARLCAFIMFLAKKELLDEARAVLGDSGKGRKRGKGI